MSLTKEIRTLIDKEAVYEMIGEFITGPPPSPEDVRHQVHQLVALLKAQREAIILLARTLEDTGR